MAPVLWCGPQGMSPNAADYDGRTALMLAAGGGHEVRGRARGTCLMAVAWPQHAASILFPPRRPWLDSYWTTGPRPTNWSEWRDGVLRSEAYLPHGIAAPMPS